MAAVFPELREEYLLEEFVDAPIVTYDGMTDTDGAVRFENTLVYGEGLIEYARGKDTFFYVDRSIPDALRRIGRALVRRFDIRRKFFHFEFFRVDGGYVPIEINCRPPGGAIIDMMNYSIDGDLYRAWVHMLLGRPLDLPEDKRYCVAYVGRKDTPHALGHDELVARIGPRLVEHADNPPLFWEVMGAHRYIYRCPERGGGSRARCGGPPGGLSPWPATSSSCPLISRPTTTASGARSGRPAATPSGSATRRATPCPPRPRPR